MSVQGLEVNQSIQYYRANQHLTQVADQGPDNSVRLVAEKAASMYEPISAVARTPVLTKAIHWHSEATVTPEDSTYPVYLEFFLANDNCQSLQVTLNFYLSG